MNGLSRRDFFLSGTPIAALQLGLGPRIPVLLLDPESSLNPHELQSRAPLNIKNDPADLPREREFLEARGAILATSDPKWISAIPGGTHVFWPAPPKLSPREWRKLTRNFGNATHCGVTLRYSSTLAHLAEQLANSALEPGVVRALLPANSRTPIIDQMNAAEIFLSRSGRPMVQNAAAKGETIAQFLFSSGVLEVRFPDGCLSFSTPFREPSAGFLRAPDGHSPLGPETSCVGAIVRAVKATARYDDPAANSVRSWIAAILSGNLNTLFTRVDFARGLES